MTCQRIVPLLEFFIDGELPPDKTLEVEQHLAECERCTEHLRLSEAFRVATRSAVQEAAQPSEALKARVSAAFAEERLREADEPEERGRWGWGTILPLAAAAGTVLVLAGTFRNSANEVVKAPEAVASASLSVDQLIEELIEYHTKPPAPDITEPSMVEQFEPEVGIPVRLPSLKQYGGRWVGGSLIVIHNQKNQRERAAYFRYRMSNRPVTIYVYNAARVPLRGALEPRVVQNVPVHVGARSGYSIAARERKGIGYLVAADLNDAETAELAATIH